MICIPEVGTKVRIAFKNSPTFAQVEGIVHEWETNECVLVSEDNAAYIIIPNISDNVLFIKVINPDTPPLPAPIAGKKEIPLSLSPLQARLIEINANANVSSNTESSNYVYPGFLKKQGS